MKGLDSDAILGSSGRFDAFRDMVYVAFEYRSCRGAPHDSDFVMLEKYEVFSHFICIYIYFVYLFCKCFPIVVN